MIDVAHDHFANEFSTDLVIVLVVPPRKFIQNVQTLLIAQIQELRIRRIMRHPDRIHVHAFDQRYVLLVNLLAQTTPRIRPERVPVRAFQNKSPPVYIKTVTVAHFHRPKSKSLTDSMEDLVSTFQTHFNRVQIWRLRSPLK